MQSCVMQVSYWPVTISREPSGFCNLFLARAFDLGFSWGGGGEGRAFVRCPNHLFIVKCSIPLYSIKKIKIVENNVNKCH